MHACVRYASHCTSKVHTSKFIMLEITIYINDLLFFLYTILKDFILFMFVKNKTNTTLILTLLKCFDIDIIY
jgi:hypothetical protein